MPDYYNIANESDLMKLEYEDDSKIDYYGSDIPDENREGIWYFDIWHSGIERSPRKYQNENKWISSEKYGGSSGSTFIPNESLDGVAGCVRAKIENGTYTTEKLQEYDTGENMRDIKSVIAPNIGNYGMTARQKISITNDSNEPINIQYYIYSSAKELYHFAANLPQLYKSSEGGSYSMKASETPDTPEVISLVNKLQPNQNVDYYIGYSNNDKL